MALHTLSVKLISFIIIVYKYITLCACVYTYRLYFRKETRGHGIRRRAEIPMDDRECLINGDEIGV